MATDHVSSFIRSYESKFKRIVQLGAIVQTHPFTWDPVNHRPIPVKSSWRLFLWKFNALLMSTFSLYFFLRLFYLTGVKTASTVKKLYQILTIGLYSFLPVLTWLTWTHRLHFCAYAQGMKDYFINISQTRISTANPGRNKHSKIISIGKIFESPFFLMVLSIGCYLIACSAVYPDGPESVYPVVELLLGSNFRYPFMTRTISFILQAYMSFNVVTLELLIGSKGIHTLVLILNRISEIKQLRRQNHQSTVIRPEELKLYRELYLVMNETNCIFSMLIWATELILIVSIVCTAFTAIRAPPGWLSWAAAFLGSNITTYLILLFTMCAEFFQQSSRLLQEYHSSATAAPSSVRKSLEAFRPVCLRIGSFFFIDKMIVLTLLKILFDSTINILLLDD